MGVRVDYKESWAPKNWCFWTVVLEKTLESPLNYKEEQPVHLKEEQSWVFIGRMLKLKLQYFGHLMWKTHSWEKTLMLGKIEDWRRRGWQRMRWLDGITDLMDMSWVSSGSWWWTGRLFALQSMGSQRVRQDWATELNWIELFLSSGDFSPTQWLNTGLLHGRKMITQQILINCYVIITMKWWSPS